MKIFEKRDMCGDGRYCYYYLFGKKIGRNNDRCYYFFDERYVGWHDWKFELAYEECGYEEGNGELHISILGWHSVFKMPWKSKRFPYGDCDAPKYGISIYDNTFWVHLGGKGNLNGGSKWWTWDLPFFSYEHVRHQVECEDGMIDYDGISGESNHWRPLYEIPFVRKYEYDYTDSYDGSVVPCVFWVEEREWRPKWLTWTKRFGDVRRYIEIEFKGEVGKKKGSWKGGCVGCSYDLLPGETPAECIRRMEKERKF